MTDPFHELCQILREIGATLTYYGGRGPLSRSPAPLGTRSDTQSGR